MYYTCCDWMLALILYCSRKHPYPSHRETFGLIPSPLHMQIPGNYTKVFHKLKLKLTPLPPLPPASSLPCIEKHFISIIKKLDSTRWLHSFLKCLNWILHGVLNRWNVLIKWLNHHTFQVNFQLSIYNVINRQFVW